MTSLPSNNRQPLSQNTFPAFEENLKGQIIKSTHWQDWQSSRVDPDIIRANVVSLDGNAAYSYLLYAPGLDRSRSGRLSAGLLYRYSHLDEGGWWCNGSDPLNNWQPMLWGCFKPDRPYLDPKKQKPVKYEHPKGAPRGTFFLNVPWRLGKDIADRSGDRVRELFNISNPKPTTPQAGSTWEDEYRLPERRENAIDPNFWRWVSANPDVPVILTEGAKKAGSLLSHGYAAIGLPGIHGGYSTLTSPIAKETIRQLVRDLECIATPGRTVYLAFDQDTKPNTIQNVRTALRHLSTLLQKRGVKVHVITWSGNSKGIDDLVASEGAQALHNAIEQADPIETWTWKVNQGQQLTIVPTVTLDTPELTQTQLKQAIPALDLRIGTIAIASGKGTGKTNLIAELLKDEPKVVSLGHRVSLQRNTCHRWELDFKNDLDKIHGRYCTAQGYTQRLGLCIDSILSIRPEDVQDGVLVIDEFMQVLRHLILGDTCAKDGKRGALIEHLTHLLSIARLVILADADANDTGINYVHQWRRDRPLILIKNTHIAPSFDATFLDTKQINDVYTRLIADLQDGKRIFIATDSRAGSKKLLEKLSQDCPNLKGLLVNSETSGEPEQRAFITNPNANVHRYDWVMGTPSLGTGVSIEVDHFDLVYGIFKGILTDGDAAQALNRVRANVPRIIWAAEKGGDPTRLHTSPNPRVIQRAIRQRSSANAHLLRSQLGYKLFPMEREDNLHRSDPSIDLYCDLLAQDNASHLAFNTALKARLQHEGSHIESIVPDGHNAEFASTMRDISKLITQKDAQAIALARTLTPMEIETLKYQDSLTKENQDSLEKICIQAFFCKKEITPEQIIFYHKHHNAIRQLEAVLYGCEVSIGRDKTEFDQQLQWGSLLTPWDLTGHEVKRAVREKLGLSKFLSLNESWTKHDSQEIADLARNYRKDIKIYLNLTIPETADNNWILAQLLHQVGLRTKAHYKGRRGEQEAVYSLEPEHFALVAEILQHRQEFRLEKAALESQDQCPEDLSELAISDIDPVPNPGHLYPLEEGLYNSRFPDPPDPNQAPIDRDSAQHSNLLRTEIKIPSFKEWVWQQKNQIREFFYPNWQK
jgi:Domain of unknown function (DUF3854)